MKYVHVFTELELDADDIAYLNNCRDTSKDLATNSTVEGYEMKSGYKQHFLEEDFTHPFYNKITALYPNWRGKSKPQISRVSGELKVHSDFREYALSIPLVDLKNPITFWSSRDDDKEIVYQYNYVKYQPVIINAQQLHSVIDNDEDRIFFQMKWFEMP